MNGMDIVQVSNIPPVFWGANNDAPDVTRTVKSIAGDAYEFVSLVGEVATYQAPTGGGDVDGRAVRNGLLAMIGASNYRNDYPSSQAALMNVSFNKWQPPVVTPEPPQPQQRPGWNYELENEIEINLDRPWKRE